MTLNRFSGPFRKKMRKSPAMQMLAHMKVFTYNFLGFEIFCPTQNATIIPCHWSRWQAFRMLLLGSGGFVWFQLSNQALWSGLINHWLPLRRPYQGLTIAFPDHKAGTWLDSPSLAGGYLELHFRQLHRLTCCLGPGSPYLLTCRCWDFLLGSKNGTRNDMTGFFFFKKATKRWICWRLNLRVQDSHVRERNCSHHVSNISKTFVVYPL